MRELASQLKRLENERIVSVSRDVHTCVQAERRAGGGGVSVRVTMLMCLSGTLLDVSYFCITSCRLAGVLVCVCSDELTPQ